MQHNRLPLLVFFVFVLFLCSASAHFFFSTSARFCTLAILPSPGQYPPQTFVRHVPRLSLNPLPLAGNAFVTNMPNFLVTKRMMIHL